MNRGKISTKSFVFESDFMILDNVIVVMVTVHEIFSCLGKAQAENIRSCHDCIGLLGKKGNESREVNVGNNTLRQVFPWKSGFWMANHYVFCKIAILVSPNLVPQTFFENKSTSWLGIYDFFYETVSQCFHRNSLSPSHSPELRVPSSAGNDSTKA
jgi:hypothetical protein